MKQRSTATVGEWLWPLVFILNMGYVVWFFPRFIIAFGWASDALKLRHETAGALEYAALALAAIALIIGVSVARPSGVENAEEHPPVNPLALLVGVAAVVMIFFIADLLFGWVGGLAGLSDLTQSGLAWAVTLAAITIAGAMTGALDRLALFIGRVTMTLVLIMVGVMFYEVVLRYVFERPTLWANELTLWTAGFVFILAGLYAMQQRSHIRIFLLYDVLPRWLQKLCDTISTLLIVIFAFCLFWGAYGEANAKFLRWETFGTAFDPPIPATLKPLILLVIVLVAIQAVANLIVDWNKAAEHHDVTDDVDIEEIAEAAHIDLADRRRSGEGAR